MKKTITTYSAEQTEREGERLAGVLRSGDFVAMYGDLGVGKTAFVRGMARYLCPDARVQSPTYTVVNEYRGKIPLYHFDMYRIDGEESLYVRRESKKMQSVKNLDIDSNFVDSIIKQTMASFIESLVPIMLTIIMAIVLYCIPGGAIIDNIAVALMGGNAFKPKDRITKRKDNIKSRARLSISMQKYGIQNKLLEETRKINLQCKETIKKTIGEKRDSINSVSQKIKSGKSLVTSFKDALSFYAGQSENF